MLFAPGSLPSLSPLSVTAVDAEEGDPGHDPPRRLTLSLVRAPHREQKVTDPRHHRECRPSSLALQGRRLSNASDLEALQQTQQANPAPQGRGSCLSALGALALPPRRTTLEVCLLGVASGGPMLAFTLTRARNFAIITASCFAFPLLFVIWVSRGWVLAPTFA